MYNRTCRKINTLKINISVCKEHFEFLFPRSRNKLIQTTNSFPDGLLGITFSFENCKTVESSTFYFSWYLFESINIWIISYMYGYCVFSVFLLKECLFVVPELGGLARRAAGCSSAFSAPSPAAHHDPGTSTK